MDYKLLQKYYDNGCTPEELKEILSWFEDPEQEKSTLASIEMHWYKYQIEENEKQDSIIELKKKINAYLKDEPNLKIISRPEKNLTKHRSSVPVLTKIAATLLLVLGAAFLFWQVSKNWGPGDLSIRSDLIEKVIKENPKGQKLKLILRDGSVVIMNSDSKITYDPLFGERNRNITLEGEAYFEVEHDHSLPFVVFSGGISVTALGTAFNVQNYPENQKSFVALAAGKVAVTKEEGSVESNDEIILNPGEIAIYSKSRQRLESRISADLKHSLGWKEGLLLFEDNNFDEVKTKLERWYGVDIIVASDQVPDWHYSGQFENVSLEKVLQGIGFTKSFDFEIKGDNVYIKFK